MVITPRGVSYGEDIVMVGKGNEAIIVVYSYPGSNRGSGYGDGDSSL